MENSVENKIRKYLDYYFQGIHIIGTEKKGSIIYSSGENNRFLIVHFIKHLDESQESSFAYLTFADFNHLNSFFNDKWQSIFTKWFEDKFSLRLDKIICNHGNK